MTRVFTGLLTALLITLAACNNADDALDTLKYGRPDAVVTPGRSIQAAVDAANPWATSSPSLSGYASSATR